MELQEKTSVSWPSILDGLLRNKDTIMALKTVLQDNECYFSTQTLMFYDNRDITTNAVKIPFKIEDSPQLIESLPWDESDMDWGRCTISDGDEQIVIKNMANIDELKDISCKMITCLPDKSFKGEVFNNDKDKVKEFLKTKHINVDGVDIMTSMFAGPKVTPAIIDTTKFAIEKGLALYLSYNIPFKDDIWIVFNNYMILDI
jgi:hypothetical protein